MAAFLQAEQQRRMNPMNPFYQLQALLGQSFAPPPPPQQPDTSMLLSILQSVGQVPAQPAFPMMQQPMQPLPFAPAPQPAPSNSANLLNLLSQYSLPGSSAATPPQLNSEPAYDRKRRTPDDGFHDANSRSVRPPSASNQPMPPPPDLFSPIPDTSDPRGQRNSPTPFLNGQSSVLRRAADPRARVGGSGRTGVDATRASPAAAPADDGRLHLVLDLDNTLIHATSDPRARNLVTGKVEDMHEFLLTPPPQAKAAPFTVYVKLRPGVQAFLQQARSLFDLHIYTMGTKEYADGIAKILDPEGVLFNGKIISRDDATIEEGQAQRGAPLKSLANMFPNSQDDRRVLVLDDREDVWSRGSVACGNLVKIEPFTFFVGLKSMNESAAGVNPASSSSPEALETGPVSEAQRQAMVAADDDHLACVLSVLRAVHRSYIQQLSSSSPSRGSPDVREILQQVMKRVLSSVRLAFVGFTTDPEEFQGSDLWNKAVQFGAEAFVPRELDAEGHPFSAPPGDRLTHIIVSRGTTYSKVRDQLGLSSLEGIHVVHWRWLVDCTKNWQPQKEDPYYIDESFRK